MTKNGDGRRSYLYKWAKLKYLLKRVRACVFTFLSDIFLLIWRKYILKAHNMNFTEMYTRSYKPKRIKE